MQYRLIKKAIQDFITKFTGHRYYEILSTQHAPINIRVDIFGRAQHLQENLAIQQVYQRPTPYIWMNMLERNPKSPWVKERKDI